MIGTSMMSANPDIPEAHLLRGWYDLAGKQDTFQEHSRSAGAMGTGGGFNRAEMKSLQEVKQSQLGTSDKPDYFSTRATIVHIKAETIAYPACSSPNCQKKVVQDGDSWRCDKCNVNHNSPTWRLVFLLRRLLFVFLSLTFF
jgi:replication factor A1